MRRGLETELVLAEAQRPHPLCGFPAYDLGWLGEVREASIAKLPGIEKLSESDLAALFRAAEELKVSPDALATIISLESGFDPAIQNKHTKATGLIQFVKGTAEVLGTSLDALKRMTFQQQLPFVVKFYKGSKCTGLSVGRLYLCTFCPAVMNDPDDTLIGMLDSQDRGPCSRATMNDVYIQNKGLDINKDGAITVGDIQQRIEAQLAAVQGRVRFNPDTPPEQVVSGGSGWAKPLGLAALGGVLYVGAKMVGWVS